MYIANSSALAFDQAMATKCFYVYIMSNFTRSVLYTGVTNDIRVRVLQHKNGEGSIFTSKYKCYYLLYFEEYFYVDGAVAREKQLKNWQRKWKDELIKRENPGLKDLAADWYD
jgi:putative endonuclease